MDSDSWNNRPAAAKRQLHHLLHNHHQTASAFQLDRLNLDDIEVEEENRPDIACPYCYEDYDIGSLCSHLEDDHSYDLKPTACPICSVKVSRDMLGHISLQHGHLLKLQRRRRLRRVAIPNSQALSLSSLLGRDLREAHLQVLLGGGGGGSGSGFRSTNYASSNPLSNLVASSPDPFLSSLALNFHGTSEVDDFSRALASSTAEDNSLKSMISARSNQMPSFDSSLSYEEWERRMKQAGFVQDLILCTLLED